ncbi:MAG: AraC family transcriptional regulator [Kiritimatiellae bacterium]|nr:AraC family transcriptional regulator [Kiritimatiellia bacterium]
MLKQVCTEPFEYCDNPERRVLNLEHDSLPCVPALGLSHYSSVRPTVERHMHPGCVEISYCARGDLTFDCEGSDYQLMPGDVLVVQPHVRHRLSMNPKGMILYWLFFRLDHERETLLKLPQDESLLLRQKLSGMPLSILRGNPRVRAAFQQLFNTYDSYERGPLRSLVMRTAVLQLLLAVIELSEHVAPLKKHDVMAEMIAEIQSNPQEERNIDDLAQDIGMSKSLFIARFKQLTGLPPYAYILHCKMVKAKTLLTSEHGAITDVAYELGFSSSQHFAMQFKRQFGITPSQWISTFSRQ